MTLSIFYLIFNNIRNVAFFLLSSYLVLCSIGISAQVSAAGSQAHIKGSFGSVHNWPIIPLAMMLTPEGRVFAYGTTTDGKQSAKLNYVIWDPSKGTSAEAFQVLSNTTETDIFCAAQALIPTTGHALVLGGDSLVNGIRNYANNNVNIFDFATDSLIRHTKNMAYKRWYATAVTLSNGNHIVLGGRNNKPFAGTSTKPSTEATYSPTPEIRALNGSWRTLYSASSEEAYGELGGGSWNYPRAWLNPQGNIFIINHAGAMYNLNQYGSGSLTKYKERTAASSPSLPSIMFAPGRILSIRKDRVAVVVDINDARAPVITPVGQPVRDRQYGNATVLANGHVWMNGGSSTGNTLTGVALDSELWNPTTGTWSAAASATRSRLYHSASMLLPDGTVITAGGGAPGPVNQLNGEVYFPPYLFKKDGSGQFAARPKITDAPSHMIGWNQSFSVEATHTIARITLTRLGTVTHSFDNESRFLDLPVSQAGRIVTVKSPASASIIPPGFYMLFAWNPWGFPSEAKIIQIGENT